MNDLELLELAAKAARLDVEWHSEDGAELEAATDGMWLKGQRSGSNSKYWNPLTDDGDALRLAALLSIDIEWQNVGDFPEPFVEAYRRAGEGESYFCALEEEGDVRRAIVRVAAEIGKNMP